LIRVFLADDHEVVREGLRRLKSTAKDVVVGEAADGRAVLDAVEKRPDIDVLVLDLSLPAVIREGPVARKILAHLGLPTEPPRLRRAQPDPHAELWGTGPPDCAESAGPDDEFVRPAPADDLDQRRSDPAE
jgi:CheY-like chemotaxis protein